MTEFAYLFRQESITSGYVVQHSFIIEESIQDNQYTLSIADLDLCVISDDRIEGLYELFDKICWLYESLCIKEYKDLDAEEFDKLELLKWHLIMR